MALFEIPLTATIEAANEAAADAVKVKLEKLLASVKPMVKLQVPQLQSFAVGKPKVKP
jgi:hypothetical protein